MIGVKERLRGREGLLLAGDLACFLLFAVLGLRSHEDGITVAGVLRAALPFQAGWVLVTLLGKQSASATDSRRVTRLWVPAWAIGLILRTLLFDRSFAVTFAIVALLVNGVLLMVWRSVLAPLVLRRDKGQGARDTV
jgi:hypothetical protein